MIDVEISRTSQQVLEPAPPVRMAPAGRVTRAPGPPAMVPVITLVLWIACLAVGVLGQVLAYPAPRTPRPEPPAIAATLLKVELTDEPLAEISEAPATTGAGAVPPPPLLAAPVPVPSAPTLVEVAQPSPRIAFELPVEGAVRRVEAETAASARREVPGRTDETSTVAVRPAATGAAEGPRRGTGGSFQTLAFGQGEGRQPAPEYPRQAVRERQQGTVVVRLTVGEHGRVMTAEAVAPSPWPLLDAAALRTVRERWQFKPGPVRLYEVPIRFELTRG